MAGNVVSVTCILTNSLGADLSFIVSHDWYGRNPNEYHPLIKKNDPAVFTHVGDALNGSKSAVVYALNDTLVWMVCWKVTSTGKNNCVFTEIHEAGHPFDWDFIEKQLKSNTAHCTWNGYSSTVTIEDGTSPVVKAEISKSAAHVSTA